jgi:hypothetical protein
LRRECGHVNPVINIAEGPAPAAPMPVSSSNSGLPWWAKVLILGGALVMGLPLLITFAFRRFDR